MIRLEEENKPEELIKYYKNTGYSNINSILIYIYDNENYKEKVNTRDYKEITSIDVKNNKIMYLYNLNLMNKTILEGNEENKYDFLYRNLHREIDNFSDSDNKVKILIDKYSNHKVCHFLSTSYDKFILSYDGAICLKIKIPYEIIPNLYNMKYLINNDKEKEIILPYKLHDDSQYILKYKNVETTGGIIYINVILEKTHNKLL